MEHVRSTILLHQNFVAPNQSGNSRGWTILRRLANSGWDVDVIAPSTGYLGDAARGARYSDDDLECLRIHRLDLRNRGVEPLARIKATIEFTWRALCHGLSLPRPDVVYAATAPSPPVMGAITISVWRGAPMLLEVSDLWPLWLVEAGSLRSPIVRITLEFVEALQYRYAAHIVTTGATFAPYLEHFGVGKERLTPVLSGVESWIRRPDEKTIEARRRSMGLENRQLAIYAGSFNEAYGIELLLEAVAKVRKDYPDLIWLFVGNGRSLPSLINAEAEGLPVRYLGNLSRIDVVKILGIADFAVISLLPSKLLGSALSGKLFDYMAGALPVLVTADGITAEFVRKSGCGITVAGSGSDAIASAVGDLLGVGQEELRKMGARGECWGRANADADQFSSRVALAFEDLVAGPRPGFRRNMARLFRAMFQAAIDVCAGRSRYAAASAFGDQWSRHVEGFLAVRGQESASCNADRPKPRPLKT